MVLFLSLSLSLFLSLSLALSFYQLHSSINCIEKHKWHSSCIQFYTMFISSVSVKWRVSSCFYLILWHIYNCSLIWALILLTSFSKFYSGLDISSYLELSNGSYKIHKLIIECIQIFVYHPMSLLRFNTKVIDAHVLIIIW